MLGTIGKSGFKYVFISYLALTLASCVPIERIMKSENRIDVLEKRVIALERRKFRALTDIEEEMSLFRKRMALDVGKLENDRRYYKKEVSGIKKEFELMAADGESERKKLKKIAAAVSRLNKRLGDQEIVIDELRTFFQGGVNNYSTASGHERRAAFEKALKLYENRLFKKAKEEFDSFRIKYPDSELTDDCLFFIAYINFLEEKYSEASLRFFEMIEQFPQSDRLNEAKWWQAAALERSGDLNGALDAYERLAEANGDNPLGRKARARLEQLESLNSHAE